VLALEAYLDESGLAHDKIPAELARYFKAPASYEEAMRARLIDTLTKIGTEKLDGDDRSGALDVFDRVLTIDPENEKVLAILDRLNRRARFKMGLLAVAGLGVLVFGGYEIHERSKGLPAGAPNIDLGSQGTALEHRDHVVHEQRPPDATTLQPDARVEVVMAPRDAHVATVAVPDAAELVTAQPDAAIALEPVKVSISVLGGSRYRIDNTSPFVPVVGNSLMVTVTDHPLKVTIQNDLCQEVSVTVDRNSKNVGAGQQFLAGRVTPACPGVADVSVSVAGEAWTLGTARQITFDQNALNSSQLVKVVFTGGKNATVDSHTVKVKATEDVEVKCALH
jgi:hypothetical protein